MRGRDLRSMNELAAKIHAVAVKKGWYTKPEDRIFATKIALCHCELSEALEEYRGGTIAHETHSRRAGVWEISYIRLSISQRLTNFLRLTKHLPKPVGVPIELADLLIRTLDMCAFYSIDIGSAMEIKMKYNEQRPYRHGGKAC